jgi:hypothetical protein
MLTKGDEYPLHQTPEPIAFSGSDRNFYDRYFFNGSQADGSGFFAVSFGVYPHLNVADAHLSVVRGGTQHCLHASRILNMERMDLRVGPIRIEVIEPLQALRLVVEPANGFAADLTCEGRLFPVQEPRFTRRNGPRMMMDVTRFTQTVRWRGWIEIDGKRETYGEGAVGVRDRSWGVRPIGASDPQPAAPPTAPQFYWLWAPSNFPKMSLFYHVNEDAAGAAWNGRVELGPDGAGPEGRMTLANPRMKIDFASGTRHARAAALTVTDAQGRDHQVTWTPIVNFQMKGIGYGHPTWGHGAFKGEAALEREDFKLADLNPLEPQNLHIQAVSAVRHDGPGGEGSSGIGSLEQLIIGQHAPSGFKAILDGAP